MALVSMREMLAAADRNQFAVGAFNANNMEIVQAIIQAAEAEKAPVIMQASQGAIKYAGLEYITGMVRIAAADSSVPVALHLDHGTDFDQVIRCIRSGFSSVMYDDSKQPRLAGQRQCRSHHRQAAQRPDRHGAPGLSGRIYAL